MNKTDPTREDPPMSATPDDLSDLYTDRVVKCVVTSFGTDHGDIPHGHALFVDARLLPDPLDDDQVRDKMATATGLDAFTRDYVLQSHGARRLVDRTARLASVLLAPENMTRWSGAQLRRVDIHVAGRRGRHRSVALAEEIATALRAAGVGCEVEHVHLDSPQP